MTRRQGWAEHEPSQDEPAQDSARVIRALQELELSEGERADLLPIALRLAQPEPLTSSAAATQRLADQLAQRLFSPSPVRQAIRAHRAREGTMGALLGLARAQISMLHPLFWVLSAGIVAVGAVSLSSDVPLNQALFLQSLGPLLAFLGAWLAFRGMGLRVLECEMACPPSLVEMTLARLVIVLGYDLALGLAMSWVVSAHTRLGLALVLAHWLMPLLLVIGVALALSEWLTIAWSATLAYAAWLSLVAMQMATQPNGAQMWSTSTMAEVVLGIVGVILLALTLVRMRDVAPRWLPHV
jgi:hypothetical protein